MSGCLGQQRAGRVADDAGGEDVARRPGRDVDRREMLRMAATAALDEDTADRALLGGQMSGERRGALIAETRGTFLHDSAVELRHARGRRPGAWREGEDMDM